MNNPPLIKRTWVWIMNPKHYDITCDICNGTNITWSEFKHHIWCYDCKKDTPGTPGIGDGPLPLNLSLMMGISWDRIDLTTNERIYLIQHDDGSITWEFKMKQVIVIRKDLKCRKGKMMAQTAHASLAAILDDNHQIKDDQRIRDWLEGLFTKVVVYVNSEEELLDIHEQAKENGLITSLITDAGLTEFNNVPTKTAVAIGPDFYEVVDKITGHLKLL